MQTLLRCPYRPCAQSSASTSVRTLKSQALTVKPLFGHTEILHNLTGMGSAALAAALPYPGKMTQISHKGQGSTIKQIKNKNKKGGRG